MRHKQKDTNNIRDNLETNLSALTSDIFRKLIFIGIPSAPHRRGPQARRASPWNTLAKQQCQSHRDETAHPDEAVK